MSFDANKFKSEPCCRVRIFYLWFWPVVEYLTYGLVAQVKLFADGTVLLTIITLQALPPFRLMVAISLPLLSLGSVCVAVSVMLDGVITNPEAPKFKVTAVCRLTAQSK